jgi:beta-N-acetylhexosaminidase
MTQEITADPALGRLADAVLIPPFGSGREPDWIRAALRGGLAGVTLFGPNVQDGRQLSALTARLRAATTEPVIAIDEEGGDVTRISHRTGSDYPGNAALGAIDDTELTRLVYAALGADLAALGINLDLAPAVDVNTAPDNPVIGTRSFGADPDLVARHAAAAVTGLQSAGVAACAKHFPGHGSTSADSHLVLATVDAPLSIVRSRDLPPFEAAIGAGVRAVMPSHLRVPELTGDLPASLSRRAQTDLLRGELGFTGVIVSAVPRPRSGPTQLPRGQGRARRGGAVGQAAWRAARGGRSEGGRPAGLDFRGGAAGGRESRRRPEGRRRRGQDGRRACNSPDRPGSGPARRRCLRAAPGRRQAARRPARTAVQPGGRRGPLGPGRVRAR